MGVRSPTKKISELGFLKIDYRGINDIMGLEIFVDC